jgi:DNA polymerase-3 subunit beta
MSTKYNSKLTIVSADKDFLQLVNNNITVYSPIIKEFYTPKAVKDKFGLPPFNFILYKTLMGDNSDKIEGVPGLGPKKLFKLFPELIDDEITLELLENTLIIKQQHSKFKLPTFDSNSFPTFPTTQDKPQITLDSLNLIQNLKKISPAIDTNNPKFELNGALINIKNDSTDLVGTDTRRLAIATIPGNNPETLSLIVPKKAILEIQKLFLDQINIFFDETNLIIHNENYYFYTRLINGKFPDYQRIIPSTTKHQIVLPKKEMIDSIKMITTISQEIKMTLLSDSIIFHSLSADNVEAKTELEIRTGLNDKFEISFNSKYILDFISQINKNEFTMEFNEPTLPFILKDDNFITIIMPIVA